MSRGRAFFFQEAAGCLAELRSARGGDGADHGRLHAAARRLRGSAQLARYGTVAAVAERLERQLKEQVEAGTAWDEAETAAFQAAVTAMAAAVQAAMDGTIPQDARTTMSTERQGGGEAVEIAIEELEYAPKAALERALELRAPLEDGIVTEDTVGPILDEIFDLIRLGMR
jgi:HPt (histidine-containing phosphotransfer) domain-containing protein